MCSAGGEPHRSNLERGVIATMLFGRGHACSYEALRVGFLSAKRDLERSVDELATAMGVDPKPVYRLELGILPEDEARQVAERFAAVTGVSLATMEAHGAKSLERMANRMTLCVPANATTEQRHQAIMAARRILRSQGHAQAEIDKTYFWIHEDPLRPDDEADDPPDPLL